MILETERLYLREMTQKDYPYLCEILQDESVMYAYEHAFSDHEVGYLFQKNYWHKGYASEAAIACKKYAFNKLNANEVFSIIRDTNMPHKMLLKIMV